MADVTGPISTLPGSGHRLPEGAMCDQHDDRPAVARVQGETDSFGCEMYDLCQECLDIHRKHQSDPANRVGKCDWCKADVTDLRKARDFEEGMAGPVYDVCGTCIDKRDARVEEELEYQRSTMPDCDDYDDGEDD